MMHNGPVTIRPLVPVYHISVGMKGVVSLAVRHVPMDDLHQTVHGVHMSLLDGPACVTYCPMDPESYAHPLHFGEVSMPQGVHTTPPRYVMTVEMPSSDSRIRIFRLVLSHRSLVGAPETELQGTIRLYQLDGDQYVETAISGRSRWTIPSCHLVP